MSGAQEQRRRRPLRMFLVVLDLKLQDQLDGTIRLQRGNICQEQDAGRSRGEHIWVKVLDYGCVVKIDKQYLTEVPSELSGLLEPVSEPESRLKLLANPRHLQRLANLPMGTPLFVHLSQSGEPVEAELRFRGPMTKRSSAVLFGVQLKGAAVGRGVSNGSYKGHQLFICPEASALFLPANQISLPRLSRGNGSEQPDRDHHQYNGLHDNHHQRHPSIRAHPSPPFPPAGVCVLPRTAESAPLQLQPSAPGPPRGPASPPPLQVGLRVCFPHKDTVQGGEVRYCGPLPGRASSGTYVGILLDTPVGNWDGSYKGERLCHIPSPLYGHLLPLSKVTAEPKSRRQAVPYSGPTPAPAPAPGPAPNSRLVLKLTQSTPGPSPLLSAPKPAPSAPLISPPKTALMPPQLRSAKLALKPPPPNKPVNKPLPLPPIKAQDPPSPTVPDQPQPSNGAPTNALWSPGYGSVAEENEETGLEVELEVGSMVEVNDPPLFGVIRWIGQISGVPEPVAGIELDQELTAGTDGSYLGERHFRCPTNKGLFVKLRNCRRDSRFPAPETPVNQVERCNSIAFAEWGSERVEELTPPEEGEEARQRYQGWKRGIQGHLNSCYLDASLFSLFSCCSSLDWVLLWPTNPEDGSHASQAQDLLHCEIVNPLRRFGYVCASKTMALRRLLEAENSDTGFTNQEKDPEEFLNKLFQILRVEPLLKIRSMTQQPQECHLYQLFPPSVPLTPSSPVPLSPPLSPLHLSSPPASFMRVASVQILLETSFLHTGLKFTEAPSCLPLLMPRFGKDFKMFDAILPSLSIDITDLLDDTLRQCSICQAVAEWECMQCFDDPDITPGKLKQYCHTCNTQVHSHKKRASHRPGHVGVPGGPWTSPLHAARQRMSLFAVTCIETSHYVSFVKHGPQPSDWLFFDSMADREGGENGFNIPQVRACPEVGRYLSLSEEELSRIDPASLRESVRRLLCDSYMCLYHSPELSLYK